MKKTIVISSFFVALTLGYYGYGMMRNDDVDQMSQTQELASKTPVQVIAMSEVEKHATKDDCYMAIEGKVYDVTEYTKSGWHPGKEAILLGCGKDATEIFNNRPGSGSSHSSAARKMLSKYEIGQLAQ